MKQANFQLSTLSCPTCLAKVEGAIKSVDGVDKDSVKVSFNTSKAKFEFDDSKTNAEAVEQAITKLGVDVKESKVK